MYIRGKLGLSKNSVAVRHVARTVGHILQFLRLIPSRSIRQSHNHLNGKKRAKRRKENSGLGLCLKLGRCFSTLRWRHLSSGRIAGHSPS
ncbi:hypothetical protein R1flu_024823 [Riccia fluitans]|uniref:Uncharacterized protein n=1 Tax=Riccia fluitans TaxID=41844 RepID=A0ABD1XW04_9MARC